MDAYQREGENYGDSWFRIYDEFNDVLNKEAENKQAAEFLSHFNARDALELGVGLGHVASLLAERGSRVFGVDNSIAMLSELQSRHGASVSSALGDISSFSLDEMFDLAYCVNHTFSYLQTPEEQISCFESTRRVLTKDGRFVIHLRYPDPDTYQDAGLFGRQRTSVVYVENDTCLLRVARLDRNRQMVSSQDVWIRKGTVRQVSQLSRFVYPSEMDLIASMTGFKLEERWSDWSRSTFTNQSRQYISVYVQT